MQDNYLKKYQDLIISVDEVDYYEKLKPSAILQYFQDIATEHAVDIGIGFEEMKSKNLAWILSRVSARVFKLPKIGDTVRLYTYPRKPNIVDAIRDYYMVDSAGNVIITGTSKWCVLDFISHAIRRCAPLFNFQDSAYNPNNAIEDGNQPLPIFDGEGDLKKEFCVNITDLDRNIHMNNAKYGDVIYNCCAKDYLDTRTLKSFDINFVSELKYNEKYSVVSKSSETESSFEATKNEDVCIFRAKIEWNTK